MKTFVAALSLTLAALASVVSVTAFGCKSDEVRGWMTACDSLVDISQIKCDNKGCHAALHRLIEEETTDCYVSSKLGPASDLDKYVALDHFCHGEGPDPTETTAATTAPSKTNQTTSGSGSVVKNSTTTVVEGAPVALPSSSPSPAPTPTSAASPRNVVVAATAFALAALAFAL